MATTIQAIRDALQVEGNPLFYDGEQTLLITLPHRGQMMVVYVHLLEEGGYLRYRIPFYLDLSKTPYRARVIEKLLELNYNIKLLKFGMDPTDGEVSVEINLPLDDGVPTRRQLHRCMFYLTNPAMQERDNLLTLMETGIYPGSEDDGFRASLDRLLLDKDSVGDEIDIDQADTGQGEQETAPAGLFADDADAGDAL
jgi:hypothetical protein